MRAASGGQVREVGRVLVFGNEYGNLYFIMVTGELYEAARAFLWNVGRFPGVVGFSFSGLFLMHLV